jgi:hypothetical protein
LEIEKLLTFKFEKSPNFEFEIWKFTEFSKFQMLNFKFGKLPNFQIWKNTEFQIWKITEFLKFQISNWITKKPAKAPPRMLSELNYEKSAFTKRIWEKAGPFGLTYGFFKIKSTLKAKPNTP